MDISRVTIEKYLAMTIGQVSTKLGRVSARPELYSTLICTGPLRGKTLYMTQTETAGMPLGRFERHITAQFQAHIAPGMTVYDVGAHIGYHTILMSMLVGAEGKVYAFEPNPRNLMALQANVQANARTNVTIIDQAVSDATQLLQFATFDYSLVGHIATDATPADAKLIELQATSLDEFVFLDGNPAPDLIKVDVEGAEGQVFFGMRRILQEYRPIIIAEMRRNCMQEISTLLDSNGFTVHPLIGGWEMGEHDLADVLFLPSS